MRLTALFVSILIFSAAFSPAAADDTPRIQVTGMGEATLVPDMAEVQLAVTREADTARAALDANNEAMTTVLAALREEGIEERDLQTSGFSIQPRMVYPSDREENPTPRIVGYTVSNQLSVRVRDLSRLGTIIDRSVTLGVNEGGHIAFSHSDPASAIDEARTEAVRDALRRARTLATAAGGSLGRVRMITEQDATSPPVPVKRLEMAMRASDTVPVAAGEHTYRVHVTMTFEYER